MEGRVTKTSFVRVVSISGRFESGTAIATTLDKVVSKKSGDRLLELVVKDVSAELVLYKAKRNMLGSLTKVFQLVIPIQHGRTQCTPEYPSNAGKYLFQVASKADSIIFGAENDVLRSEWIREILSIMTPEPRLGTSLMPKSPIINPSRDNGEAKMKQRASNTSKEALQSEVHGRQLESNRELLYSSAPDLVTGTSISASPEKYEQSSATIETKGGSRERRVQGLDDSRANSPAEAKSPIEKKSHPSALRAFMIPKLTAMESIETSSATLQPMSLAKRGKGLSASLSMASHIGDLTIREAKSIGVNNDVTVASNQKIRGWDLSSSPAHDALASENESSNPNTPGSGLVKSRHVTGGKGRAGDAGAVSEAPLICSIQPSQSSLSHYQDGSGGVLSLRPPSPNLRANRAKAAAAAAVIPNRVGGPAGPTGAAGPTGPSAAVGLAEAAEARVPREMSTAKTTAIGTTSNVVQQQQPKQSQLHKQGFFFSTTEGSSPLVIMESRPAAALQVNGSATIATNADLDHSGNVVTTKTDFQNDIGGGGDDGDDDDGGAKSVASVESGSHVSSSESSSEGDGNVDVVNEANDDNSSISETTSGFSLAPPATASIFTRLDGRSKASSGSPAKQGSRGKQIVQEMQGTKERQDSSGERAEGVQELQGKASRQAVLEPLATATQSQSIQLIRRSDHGDDDDGFDHGLVGSGEGAMNLLGLRSQGPATSTRFSSALTSELRPAAQISSKQSIYSASSCDAANPGRRMETAEGLVDSAGHITDFATLDFGRASIRPSSSSPSSLQSRVGLHYGGRISALDYECAEGDVDGELEGDVEADLCGMPASYFLSKSQALSASPPMVSIAYLPRNSSNGVIQQGHEKILEKEQDQSQSPHYDRVQLDRSQPHQLDNCTAAGTSIKMTTVGDDNVVDRTSTAGSNLGDSVGQSEDIRDVGDVRSGHGEYAADYTGSVTGSTGGPASGAASCGALSGAPSVMMQRREVQALAAMNEQLNEMLEKVEEEREYERDQLLQQIAALQYSVDDERHRISELQSRLSDSEEQRALLTETLKYTRETLAEMTLRHEAAVSRSERAEMQAFLLETRLNDSLRKRMTAEDVLDAADLFGPPLPSLATVAAATAATNHSDRFLSDADVIPLRNSSHDVSIEAAKALTAPFQPSSTADKSPQRRSTASRSSREGGTTSSQSSIAALTATLAGRKANSAQAPRSVATTPGRKSGYETSRVLESPASSRRRDTAAAAAAAANDVLRRAKHSSSGSPQDSVELVLSSSSDFFSSSSSDSDSDNSSSNYSLTDRRAAGSRTEPHHTSTSTRNNSSSNRSSTKRREGSSRSGSRYSSSSRSRGEHASGSRRGGAAEKTAGALTVTTVKRVKSSSSRSRVIGRVGGQGLSPDSEKSLEDLNEQQETSSTASSTPKSGEGSSISDGTMGSNRGKHVFGAPKRHHSHQQYRQSRSTPQPLQQAQQAQQLGELSPLGASECNGSSIADSPSELSKSAFDGGDCDDHNSDAQSGDDHSQTSRASQISQGWFVQTAERDVGELFAAVSERLARQRVNLFESGRQRQALERQLALLAKEMRQREQQLMTESQRVNQSRSALSDAVRDKEAKISFLETQLRQVGAELQQVQAAEEEGRAERLRLERQLRKQTAALDESAAKAGEEEELRHELSTLKVHLSSAERQLDEEKEKAALAGTELVSLRRSEGAVRRDLEESRATMLARDESFRAERDELTRNHQDVMSAKARLEAELGSLKQRIQFQHSRLSTLEAQLLEAQHSAAAETIAHEQLSRQMEAELEDVRAASARTIKEFSAQLQAAQDEQQDERTRLQRRVMDLEKQLLDVDTAKAELRSRAVAAEEQLQQQVVDSYSLKSQAAQAKQLVSALETEKRLLSVRHSEKATALEGSLDDAKRSIRELRKQLAELDSRRLEEAAQLNQKCRQMAASVDDAERARASAAALVQSVQNELKQEKKLSDDRTARHNSAMEELHERIKSLEKQQSDHASQEFLNAELEILRQDLRKATSLVSQRDEALLGQQIELDSARKQLSSGKEEASKLASEVAIATDKAQSFSAELSVSRDQIEALSGEITELRNKSEALSDELAECLGQVTALQLALDAATEAASAAVVTATAAIAAEINEEIQRKKHVLEGLQAEESAARSRIESLQLEADTLLQHHCAANSLSDRLQQEDQVGSGSMLPAGVGRSVAQDASPLTPQSHQADAAAAAAEVVGAEDASTPLGGKHAITPTKSGIPVPVSVQSRTPSPPNDSRQNCQPLSFTDKVHRMLSLLAPLEELFCAAVTKESRDALSTPRSPDHRDQGATRTIGALTAGDDVTDRSTGSRSLSSTFTSLDPSISHNHRHSHSRSSSSKIPKPARRGSQRNNRSPEASYSSPISKAPSQEPHIYLLSAAEGGDSEADLIQVLQQRLERLSSLGLRQLKCGSFDQTDDAIIGGKIQSPSNRSRASSSSSSSYPASSPPTNEDLGTAMKEVKEDVNELVTSLQEALAVAQLSLEEKRQQEEDAIAKATAALEQQCSEALARLQDQLTTSEGRLKHQEQLYEDLRADLQAQLGARQQDGEAQQQQLHAQLQHQLQEQLDATAALREKEAELQAQLAASEQRLTQLEEAKLAAEKALQRQVELLQEDLNQYVAEGQEQQDEYGRVLVHLQATESELQEQKKRAYIAAQQMEQLGDEIAELHINAAKHALTLVKLQATEKELQSFKEQATAAVSRATELSDELTGVREEADDIAAKASDRVAALQQQIELEQAEKAALRGEYAALQGEATALQEEKAALQVASVKLAAELQSLREDRKAFHDKICSIESEASAAAEEAEEAFSRIERLELRLATEQRMRQELERRLRRLDPKKAPAAAAAAATTTTTATSGSPKVPSTAAAASFLGSANVSRKSGQGEQVIVEAKSGREAKGQPSASRGVSTSSSRSRVDERSLKGSTTIVRVPSSGDSVGQGDNRSIVSAASSASSHRSLQRIKLASAATVMAQPTAASNSAASRARAGVNVAPPKAGVVIANNVNNASSKPGAPPSSSSSGAIGAMAKASSPSRSPQQVVAVAANQLMVQSAQGSGLLGQAPSPSHASELKANKGNVGDDRPERCVKDERPDRCERPAGGASEVKAMEIVIPESASTVSDISGDSSFSSD